MKHTISILFYAVATIIIAISLNYFLSYVLYDVSNLYNIPILMNFSVINFLGFLFVIDFIKININKTDLMTKSEGNKSGSTIEDSMTNSLGVNLTYVFYILVSWGFTHLVHYLILKINM